MAKGALRPCGLAPKIGSDEKIGPFDAKIAGQVQVYSEARYPAKLF